MAYRTVNNLYLGCKTKLVNAVQGKNLCLFWDTCQHINALGERKVEISVLNLVVCTMHKVATRL